MTEHPPPPDWAVDLVGPGTRLVEVVSGGGREDLRQLPYYRTFWHLPIPDGAQPLDCDLPSRLALPTTPYFAWMSLVRWRGPDGWEAWGEDHDSWSPARWRAFGRTAGVTG